MKKTILFLIFPILCNMTYAQDKEGAEKLVKEGVDYHDKGDFEGAITKYDKALELDKDNLMALTEKAMSLLSLKKYDESISICQKAIETHPGEEDLKTLYVTYGNTYDAKKETDKSLEIYNEGIKLFPEFYLLRFNKGITLVSIKKYDEAMLYFQKAILLNPRHAGSHNAIARISHSNNKRIPALLAYSRFLVIEPQTSRSVGNLKNVQLIMKGDVEETGKKSMTINISASMLGDTTEDGKPKENSFTSTDLILSLTAAMDYEKKNKKKSDVENFIRKFEVVCSSISESKKDNYGFFWDYYVPYFVEMKEKNLIEPFAYICFASSENKEVEKWLKEHESEIEKFYDWSKSFNWKSE